MYKLLKPHDDLLRDQKTGIYLLFLLPSASSVCSLSHFLVLFCEFLVCKQYPTESLPALILATIPSVINTRTIGVTTQTQQYLFDRH